MAKIASSVSVKSETFLANRRGMLDLLARMNEIEARTRMASEQSRSRFEKRHQLLPRHPQLLEPSHLLQC